jgi:hypothetical protein
MIPKESTQVVEPPARTSRISIEKSSRTIETPRLYPLLPVQNVYENQEGVIEIGNTASQLSQCSINNDDYTEIMEIETTPKTTLSNLYNTYVILYLNYDISFAFRCKKQT